MQEEEFRTVTEFPDYLVSNFGRVKTKSRRIPYTHAVTGQLHTRQTEERFLKVQYNKRTGYKFHNLYKDRKPHNRNIHLLVAPAFVDNPYDLKYVNHKDGNKHNNCADNLEWCTNEYNHEHATKTGLKAKGEQIGNSKLNYSSVHAIKFFLKKGFTHSELSKAFQISRPTISSISEGKIWNHIALTGEELTQKQ